MVPFGLRNAGAVSCRVLGEHNHTRALASIFDVSHMGQVALRGDDPAVALEKLVPADIAGLASWTDALHAIHQRCRRHTR